MAHVSDVFPDLYGVASGFADENTVRARRVESGISDTAPSREKPIAASVAVMNATLIETNNLLRTGLEIQESENALLYAILVKGSGSVLAGLGQLLGDLALGGGALRLLKKLRGGRAKLKATEPETKGAATEKVAPDAEKVSRAGGIKTPAEATPVESTVERALSGLGKSTVLERSLGVLGRVGGAVFEPLNLFALYETGKDLFNDVTDLLTVLGVTDVKWPGVDEGELEMSLRVERELHQGTDMEAHRAEELGRLQRRGTVVLPKLPELDQEGWFHGSAYTDSQAELVKSDSITFEAGIMSFQTDGVSAVVSAVTPSAMIVPASYVAGDASPVLRSNQALHTGEVASRRIDGLDSQRVDERNSDTDTKSLEAPSEPGNPATGHKSLESSRRTKFFGYESNAPHATRAFEAPSESGDPTTGSKSYGQMYERAAEYSRRWGNSSQDPQYEQGSLHGACVRGTGGVLAALTGDERFSTLSGGNADSYSLGNPYLEKTGKFEAPAPMPDGYTRDSSQWRIGDTISATGGHASGNGHIQVWDGHSWVSDGKQTGILPGYSNYVLHRMSDGGVASLDPGYVADNDSTGATKRYIEHNGSKISELRTLHPPKAGTPQPTSGAHRAAARKVDDVAARLLPEHPHTDRRQYTTKDQVRPESGSTHDGRVEPTKPNVAPPQAPRPSYGLQQASVAAPAPRPSAPVVRVASRQSDPPRRIASAHMIEALCGEAA